MFRGIPHILTLLTIGGTWKMTNDEIEVIFGVMDALGLSRQWEQVIEGKISPNEFGQKLIDIVF